MNNVQQSMEKSGSQAQLIKTRILYCRSREKSVLVLLVTREIRIMYMYICTVSHVCYSNSVIVSCQRLHGLPGLAGTDYLLGS